MSSASFIIAFYNMIVVIAIVGGLIRMILNGYRTMTVIFYTFGMASLSLSYVYWFVYDIIKPTERLVFAANEVSEWAYFLMLGSTLMYAVKSVRKSDLSEYIGVFFFTIVNVVLWIAWTGEWVQDTVTGLVLAYWAYHLVRGLKQSQALVRREWVGLWVLFSMVVGAQAVTFIPNAPVDKLYLFSFLLLAAVILYFYGKEFRIFMQIRKESVSAANATENPAIADSSASGDSLQDPNSRKLFCLALLTILLTTAGLYMSGDPYYLIFLSSVPASYCFAYIPIRREAGKL